MNNLHSTLMGILTRRNMIVRDLVAASNVAQSTLSKLKTHGCSGETLRALLMHAAENDEDRREILRSYFFDELDRFEIPTGLFEITQGHPFDLKSVVNMEVYGWLYSIAVAIAEGNDEFEGIVEELAHLARRLKKEKNWEYGGQAAEDPREYPANGSTNFV
jgi:hypothetical protein